MCSMEPIDAHHDAGHLVVGSALELSGKASVELRRGGSCGDCPAVGRMTRKVTAHPNDARIFRITMRPVLVSLLAGPIAEWTADESRTLRSTRDLDNVRRLTNLLFAEDANEADAYFSRLKVEAQRLVEVNTRALELAARATCELQAAARTPSSALLKDLKGLPPPEWEASPSTQAASSSKRSRLRPAPKKPWQPLVDRAFIRSVSHTLGRVPDVSPLPIAYEEYVVGLRTGYLCLQCASVRDGTPVDAVAAAHPTLGPLGPATTRRNSFCVCDRCRDVICLHCGATGASMLRQNKGRKSVLCTACGNSEWL